MSIHPKVATSVLSAAALSIGISAAAAGGLAPRADLRLAADSSHASRVFIAGSPVGGMRPMPINAVATAAGSIVRDHRGGKGGGGGVTITPDPRPRPSSGSGFCVISCGATVGTPTSYNAGYVVRDHRSGL